MPDSNIKITSSSKVLGDSNPAVEMTLKFKPALSTSKSGRGMIQLVIPYWFNVLNKLNMMFNELDRNSCSSPDL